jgi:uncharacterized membrane protein
MGEMIALRVVHIVIGVFWAGGMLFMNFVIGPALGSLGPDGLKVMRALHRRRYFEIVLTAGLLTILAGVDLMRRDSAGFDPAWFRSRFGMGLSTGMIAAIIAFLIGAFFIRPAMNRILKIADEMEAAAPDARPAIGARMGAVRARFIALGSVASLFLVIAVVSMAVARYL